MCFWWLPLEQFTTWHHIGCIACCFPETTPNLAAFLFLLVIVWSGCRTESITALICSGRNQTEPDTGYLHLLACSSLTYTGRNAAHIHLPFNAVTYNIDQTLELTVMSILCSIVIWGRIFVDWFFAMQPCVWSVNIVDIDDARRWPYTN